MSYTRLTAPVPQVWLVQFPVAANQSAGYPVQGTIIPNPESPQYTASVYTVDSDAVFYIYNVYAPSTTALAGLDGVVKFKVNGVDQNVKFGPLSQTIPSQYHIQTPPPIVVPPAGRVEIFLVLLTNNGTAAVTVNAVVNVMKSPIGYSGKVYRP